MNSSTPTSVLDLPGQPQEVAVLRTRMPRALHRNFAWTLAGNVVYAAAQWAMLIVLARLGSAAMVGEFALALALTGPIFMLTNLNTRGLLASDARGQFAWADYLRLRWLTTGLGLTLVSGAALLGGHGSTTVAVILLVGLAKGAEAISDLVYGLLQRQDRMDRLAWSLMVRGILGLGILATLVACTHDLAWGAAGAAATWVLVLLLVDLPATRGKPRDLEGEPDQRPANPWSSWQNLGRLTILALPQGLTLFLISLTAALPRFFVESERGLGDLGIFAALAYVLVAGSTVINALGQAATPRLATVLAAGDRQRWQRLLGQLTWIGILLGLAGLAAAWWLGKPLLTLFYGADYAAHHDVFLWLMVAGALGFVASLWGYALTVARVLIPQACLYGLVMVVTLAGCVFWTPSEGMVGAAWAVALGALCQTLGSGVLLSRMAWGGDQP